MENPYQTPSTFDLAPPSSGEVIPEVIRMLEGTKGWVRFLGILGFLFCGFMVLAAMGMLVTKPRLMPLPIETLVLVYLVSAGLYFFASFKLNQYASRINLFLQQPSQLTLASALDAQRGFWKFTGIMAIIAIIFYILIFIGLFSRTL